jgi:DNA-nicking Smr family endonuclease
MAPQRITRRTSRTGAAFAILPMAKLSELRKLLDAARATAATSPARAHGKPESALPHRGGGRAATASPHRAIAAQKHASADIDLATAFADVTRLPPSRRVRHAPQHPAPIAMQRLADERDALLASKYGAEPAPQTWDIGQEIEGEQTFVRRGLGSDVLAKLRRGHWSVQSELDLHGHTSLEARDTLADFLDEARQRGYRCVRVVHGKGLTSPNREPVLKGKVRRWLSHWDDVLAYCEAPQHAGGGGAVLILLRGR